MGERAEACPLRWYALRLRHNFETTVERDLESRGYEVFFPTWIEITRWSDRERRTRRPLFPGYGFARFIEATDLIDILRTRGVAGVLGARENVPEPVEDAEISLLRRVLDVTPTDPVCAHVAGDRLRVERGPMAGIEGIVIRTRGSHRLVMRVEFLNREISVEFDVADLQHG